MLAFAGLPAAQQARFLDTLNLYLFASPQRRRQYVRTWARYAQLADPASCDCSDSGPVLKPNAS